MAGPRLFPKQLWDTNKQTNRKTNIRHTDSDPIVFSLLECKTYIVCFMLIELKAEFGMRLLTKRRRGTFVYMVRNHQDGYPYINFSQFFFLLTIYRNVNFFGKIDWSMISGQRWAGDC